MQRWEYRQEIIQGDAALPNGFNSPAGLINQLGSQGWEMVAAFPNNHNAQVQRCVFKRPLPAVAPTTTDQGLAAAGQAS